MIRTITPKVAQAKAVNFITESTILPKMKKSVDKFHEYYSPRKLYAPVKTANSTPMQEHTHIEFFA